ncbi:MAG: fatty acid CoA ligase family protein [Phycisphaerae bacterium]|jgi:acyl-CoA synthetase (AMP-forming)/AMP-acid ligase II
MDLQVFEPMITAETIERSDGGQTPAAAFNIASYLPRMADTSPDRTAVVVTRSRRRDGRALYASMTFAELEAVSNRYANGLRGMGIERGTRVLVMVKPGFGFVGLIYALFKMGAVPVLIDPGMGVSRMLECIRMVVVQAFVGIPIAQVMRVLRSRSFASVRHVVTVGRRWLWGGPTLRGLAKGASDKFEVANTGRDETAAVLFTSGSTGPAKGVVYEHGMFGAQVEAIQRHYRIEPGEIDLPTFPLFALFDPAMGMTAVIPDMDASRPAKADPAKIVGAIRDHGVTSTFGSPALWRRVASYCVEHGVKLPSLRRILIAGAPVPYHTIERLHRVLNPEADVHTPYGATESLPVSSISGREILDGCAALSRRGSGTCVGRELPGIELRVIRVSDGPLAEWSDDLTVPDGEIGELTVSGHVVTKEYFGLKAATAKAKIVDGHRIWHRIGDVGYRDQQGRIWFCGRKAHRVVTASGTLYSVRCEAIFNEHPDVERSALVGVGPRGRQRPVIVAEPVSGKFPVGPRIETFREELLRLGGASELTESIDDVLFHRSLPVDVRHNAKINREQLAEWAAERVR